MVLGRKFYSGAYRMAEAKEKEAVIQAALERTADAEWDADGEDTKIVGNFDYASRDPMEENKTMVVEK